MAPPSTLGSSQIAFLRAANASSACSIVRRRDQRHEIAAIIVANKRRPASTMAAVRGPKRSGGQLNAIRGAQPAASTPDPKDRPTEKPRAEASLSLRL